MKKTEKVILGLCVCSMALGSMFYYIGESSVNKNDSFFEVNDQPIYYHNTMVWNKENDNILEICTKDNSKLMFDLYMSYSVKDKEICDVDLIRSIVNVTYKEVGKTYNVKDFYPKSKAFKDETDQIIKHILSKKGITMNHISINVLKFPLTFYIK